MNAIIPTVSAENLTLTADHNGLVITTEWTAQPVIPADLPDGFSCTILNYSNVACNSYVLPSPKFVLSGMNHDQGAKSFALKPGQGCVLRVASCIAPQGGTATYYFVGKASA